MVYVYLRYKESFDFLVHLSKITYFLLNLTNVKDFSFDSWFIIDQKITVHL